MQNVFKNLINKLCFANSINSETAQSKLLKYLPEMENYKNKNKQKKIYLRKIDFFEKG